MRKIKEILRLHAMGLGIRQIARRTAALFLMLSLLTSVVLSGCGSSSSTTSAPQQNPPGTQQSAAEPAKADSPGQPASPVKVASATVTSVADGDTLHVKINGREEKVRLIGVNTPEIAHPDLGIKEQPYGKEAAAYTQKRLTGKQVYLELDVGERDKYGRILAYVWLEQPKSDSETEVRAKMYNAELLLNGYAQVMTVPPNVKYADTFVKFQQEARDAGKGLWGATVSGTKTSGTGKYIGNSSSKKFHLPTCEWAQKISLKNRIEFTTREEAVKAGYEPCKVCRP
ncbi:MAG: thermonuclease family protein [Syntrophothermus sp.]|uniref:thermonuclease family protein n=1 Tax=Syntrophothermus sp. TaxID=2736299 RepID=UPI00257FF7DA|nr:thermonuclease family protein [Syntrophothermus sp.]NSW84098.1 thermonuclease family protein [Syntrophothermus sp.]